MADRYDQVLLLPDEDALVAALEAGSQRTGLERHGRSHWRPLLEEVAENAEGRSQLEVSSGGGSGARYVAVAWWTDHQGRKVARVAGGNAGDFGAHRHYSRLDIDERPPLWHVFPERVYRAALASEVPRWLVSCACGETGDPEGLAWMGDRCGPCHDRREEGGAAPEPRALFETGAAVHALAVCPASRRVAASVEDRGLLLLDPATGRTEALRGREPAADADQLRPLAFSPDGSLLAAGDRRTQVVCIHDLNTREIVEIDLLADDEAVTGLTYSPDGSLLAVLGESGLLSVWARLAGEWVPGYQRSGVAAADFSPDGATLATGFRDGLVRLLRTSDWTERGRFHSPPLEDVSPLWLEYLPDGRRLLLAREVVSLPGRTVSEISLWEAEGGRDIRQALWRSAGYGVLSPDGRTLARVSSSVSDSPALVQLWDVEGWGEIGAVEWDPEAWVTALAFSRDGESLVVGTADGAVKLVPWGRLLGGAT